MAIENNISSAYFGNRNLEKNNNIDYFVFSSLVFILSGCSCNLKRIQTSHCCTLHLLLSPTCDFQEHSRILNAMLRHILC